jgi:hypothetical protein
MTRLKMRVNPYESTHALAAGFLSEHGKNSEIYKGEHDSPNPQEWGITEALATRPQTRPYQVLSF